MLIQRYTPNKLKQLDTDYIKRAIDTYIKETRYPKKLVLEKLKEKHINKKIKLSKNTKLLKKLAMLKEKIENIKSDFKTKNQEAISDLKEKLM